MSNYTNDKKFTKRDGKRFERGPQDRDKRSITDELVDLDHQLTSLLARRTRLLAKAAGTRKRKGKALVDPTQEKRMRRAWDGLVSRHGFDTATMRKLFNLANGLAYSFAQGGEEGEQTFTMRPRRAPLDLTMPGPSALEESRMWTAIAGATGATCEIAPIVLNDPLVELVKGLNGAGASMSREKGKVTAAGQKPDFHGKTVFAGGDPLNFFMLLAMALPEPGISMFSGGTALKVMDLRPVAHVLSGLGVRLTSLEPHSNGVPVRMESGGMTTNRFRIPENFPAEAAAAIALFGPTYPDGIAFTWDEEFDDKGLLSRVAAILKDCGVPCTLADDSFSVDRAILAMPQSVTFPLDPVLCTSLLAAPHFGSGRVHLDGAWPEKDADAESAVTLLENLGLEVKVSKSGITAELAERPEEIDLDVTECPIFAPLALAAGLASHSGARIRVADDFDGTSAMELGDRLGRFVRVKPNKVVVAASPKGSTWDESAEAWVSPAPEWTMGLALASYAAPGIKLANPGGLSAVWPEFWQLYVNGFEPQPDKKEPEDDGRKKGRRVRIG